MQTIIIIVISLHVLAATFWAGSTFAVARTGGAGAEQLLGPQIGSAIVAILAGGYLWHVLHETTFGTSEIVLATGAVAAIIALILQVAIGTRAAARIRNSSADTSKAKSTLLATQRISALLLGIAAITMAASRFL